MNLGWVAQSEGETAKARTWSAQTLAVHRALNHERGIATAFCNIGRVARMEDDLAGGRAYLEEALLLFRRLGERRGVAECLEELALIAVAEEEMERAARLLLGSPPSPSDSDLHRQALDMLRGRLGERDFDFAWTDGRSMSTDEAVSLALRRLSPEADL